MSNYTLAQAYEVLDESRRISAEDARRPRPDPRTARASFLPGLATILTFADMIVGQQENNPDMGLPEAVRAAAIENPELHREWIEEQNKKRAASEQEEKDSAARARASRNR